MSFQFISYLPLYSFFPKHCSVKMEKNDGYNNRNKECCPFNGNCLIMFLKGYRHKIRY